MRQLYYTSCRKNAGLQDRAGLQVRAASAGTDLGMLDAAVKFCYYYLPFGSEYRTDRVQPEDAPIRFAFLRTPELGPIALQAVYAGIDPASGRPGNPFVHLVFDDARETLDAYTVLSSWQSPFWKRVASDDRKELDEIGDLPADGVDESILAECAEEEGWRRNVAFLLDAIQHIEDSGQIFIVGEPPEIVGMLFAIARVLPRTLCKALTFTTYEKDIEGQYAKVVGTWWGSQPTDQDLPEHCYAGRRAALNLKSSRRSEGIPAHSYTQYILDQIVKDALAESVDPFLHFCEESGLASAAELDRFFQLHQATQKRMQLKEEHIQVAFANERSLSQVLASATFLANLLAAMEREPQLHRVVVDRLPDYLARDHQAAEGFAAHVYQELAARVRDGNDEGLRSLCRTVVPVVGHSERLWLRLFQELSDEKAASQLTTKVRLRLLEMWGAIPLIVEDQQRFAGWLHIPPEGLESILDALPTTPLRAWAVCVNLVAGNLPSSSAVVHILKQPQVVAAVFETVASNYSDELPDVVQLYRQTAPSGYLASLLAATKRLHPGWLVPFLSTIEPAHMGEFLAQYGQRLLSVIGQQPEFQRLLVAFEADYGDSLGRSPPILELFNAAIREGTLNSPQLVQRVEAWNFIKELADRGIRNVTPDEIRRRLACLREVTDTMHDYDAYHDVFHAFARSPLRDLENIVYEFGPSILSATAPPAPGDIRDSWLCLCTAANDDRQLASQTSFLIELFRICAGVTLSAHHRGEAFLSQPALEPTALTVFESLPKAARTQLASRQSRWPIGSRRLWRQWNESRKGFFRTALGLFLGSAAGKQKEETSDEDDQADDSPESPKSSTR